MAGAPITSGLLQRFHIKLEAITDSLKSSSTFADFVGAGKMVDPTSVTTFDANLAALIGDISIGGSPKTVDVSRWTRGNSKFIVGSNVDDIEFEVLRDRTNTMAKALEDVQDSTQVWFVVFAAAKTGIANATSDATVNVGWGTISKKVDMKDENPSTVMVTVSPEEWLDAIDA